MRPASFLTARKVGGQSTFSSDSFLPRKSAVSPGNFASSLLGFDFDRLVCPGYGFLEEILVALHRRGAQLREIPIEFRARSTGHSKLGISDAWG